ncbi:MAG: hypothetical protein A2087_01710 [Spirochaetes bacterium GWD1_61_31]|nr:MAG: hypothetical protein A2Y37_10075 [Spirochaetes bacterium GWB1_60_80]OHD29071.1 MAG: hypothetical protein A2004_14575 [Spirochaetes bacterium GWC1_61_12]OHD35898.1 MAG: hypothetical protein A2087_01710 [Spirochaetes bacterium GWD1_61_31]OHD44236.1 MAG: hypothetical protein A2Y35_06770 [Spirochaetes bacterium GWE1_60_18]OHD60404.1 MAG: hypothetical protein A2Y32_00755 [Spirochaetes bacterium GWF1_60_12]HAP43280.1 hypothetical protein [Spirochaetaceae bacterium]
MPRVNQASARSGRTILLVDDDEGYLQATGQLLDREGHDVITAQGGAVALKILRERPVDLILLDFHMPSMTGEEVVTQLRTFNRHIQVILQTGYASESPPREMLRKLDIQGYFDKSEGSEKLLLWTEAGLKAAYTTQLLLKSRQGLRFILEATPALHKLQPLQDLLQGILCQVSGLLGCANSFLAIARQDEPNNPAIDGFLAMVNQEMQLEIQAGVGRFGREGDIVALLGKNKTAELVSTLRDGHLHRQPHESALPLSVGDTVIGLIYLDKGNLAEDEIELLTIFSNQAAVAIQNSQLYSLATQDPLTGVFVRKFYDSWVLKELRTCYRLGQPLSLLMFDMDNFKAINDGVGHLGGDLALSRAGNLLLKATRTTDFVARFGGDEFVIILPSTGAAGAAVVANKILRLLRDERLTFENKPIVLQASLGVVTLTAGAPDSALKTGPETSRPAAYFSLVAETLLKYADDSLYAAKSAGKAQAAGNLEITWP